MLCDYVGLSDSSPSGLCWIRRPYKTHIVVGSPAFACLESNGYYRGRFKTQRYLAHRVVFFLTYGYWPEQVDHIDGDRGNNTPSNLRAVSRSENQHNRKAKGYCYDTTNKRWKAQIRVGGVDKHIGSFHTEEEARLAYVAAKQQLHPTAPARCYMEESSG